MHGSMDAWMHDTCNHAVMQFHKHSFRHTREADQLQKFLKNQKAATIVIKSMKDNKKLNGGSQ